jgi:MSHA biogenesis protein MshL
MAHRRLYLDLGPTARIVVTLFLAACAKAPAPATAPRTAVRLDPTASAAQADPLPALPSISGGGAIAERPRRVKELAVTNQPVDVVVRELAEQFGLQYNIAPGVTGRVNTVLRNKTLTEALDAIIPQGVSYQIENGVLRVGPATLKTEIFSLDYVSLSRFGSASTVIQRRLGAGSMGGGVGSGIGGGAGQSGTIGGADLISAVSVADAWEEIRVAVEALVFDAPAQGSQQAQGGGQSTALGVMTVGRPYTRVGTDGRRLIVNPMAGTITVTALPAQLQQIDTFIDTFEASIQRQVLIEAKIVEVNLDRSFEFGIDWNVVARAGTASAGVTSVPPGTLRRPAKTGEPQTGNIEFTLSGGPGSITAVLNALDTQGDVRVLSSPRVSALNNQRAVFDVTTAEILFSQSQVAVPNPGGQPTFVTQVTPQQINVGIVLDVLPQIGSDNTVTMNIRPVVTSVRETRRFTGADGSVFEAPVIDTRESDTMARLRASETIIIGGLMQTRREKVRSGVPGLRSIPVLGRLFTSYKDIERKAELVIFLTPTIISSQPGAAR